MKGKVVVKNKLSNERKIPREGNVRPVYRHPSALMCQISVSGHCAHCTQVDPIHT